MTRHPASERPGYVASGYAEGGSRVELHDQAFRDLGSGLAWLEETLLDRL